MLFMDISFGILLGYSDVDVEKMFLSVLNGRAGVRFSGVSWSANTYTHIQHTYTYNLNVVPCWDIQIGFLWLVLRKCLMGEVR